ncbi:MAG: hydroxyacid dehydrogenase [Deltaproteobacteria bacterium]|nr:hydroxyacid dehydrogenase [Deltaproteobacteria bacterium]
MTTILITEPMAGAPLAELRAKFDVIHLPALWQQRPKLVEQVAQARALLVRNQTQVDAEMLAHAKNLQIIGRAGVGLDNIDMQAASDAGVVVSYSPGANANAVAELTIGLAVALSRRLLSADSHTRNGGWDRMQFLGQEISGRCMAVIGCGAIGRLTAQKAVAMGLNVVGYDPFLDPEHPALAASGLRLMPFEQAIAQADYISCHVPANAQTHEMFDVPCFANMKKGAYFINTSRGNVANEAALTAALMSGHLAGAALDVRTIEPPTIGSLEALGNVILTPHIGGLTFEAQEAVLQMICSDVHAVLEGRPAVHSANFSVPRRKR